jgi:hypothetical protein|tara:strand:+ start:359 stop:1657 length:1299 start_codon:yes stop_codon:yes gene_type:complete
MPSHNTASGYHEQREHGWKPYSRVYHEQHGWVTEDKFKELEDNAFGAGFFNWLNDTAEPAREFIADRVEDISEIPLVQQTVEAVTPAIEFIGGGVRYSPGPIQTFLDNLEGTKELVSDNLRASGVDPRVGEVAIALAEEAAGGAAGKGLSLLSKIKPVRLPSSRKLATTAGSVQLNVTPGQTIDFKPPQIMEARVRSKWSKQERDLAVDENRYPTREQITNNADFRGVTGDVQAGKKGGAIRMENRPEYLAAQRGQTPQTLKRSSPTFMVPHHRMGIQDNTAFLTGLTAEEAAEFRKILNEGGLFPGNAPENLESVYDGVLSKGGRKEGMFSTDHGEIHDLADKMRKDYGIEINKNDRSLDKIRGRYIKDLPKNIKLELMTQLALQDEMIIDQVIARRMAVFRKKFGHLPFEEQKRIILEEPHRFANLSTNE